MNSLTSFIESDFNTEFSEWEKSLLAELKLSEIGSKGTKKLLSGGNWPTLSLKAHTPVHLPATAWKKASNSYAYLNEEHLAHELSEDLASGVRNFFFYSEALSPAKWQIIQKTFKSFSDSRELEVFIMGEGNYQSDSFTVVTQLISGKMVNDQGGHSIQELALMASHLVQALPSLSESVYLGVYVDSHFFHNVAKIRAAKLLSQKILAESGKKTAFKVVALTSYQGWTLYERYSNMLRNETAVASAFIGGADHVQSTGYNTLLELEGVNLPEAEHVERSRRMARNTSHVLALESMLGVVEDAAFGSYHLENLTEALCQEAWKLMQEILGGKDLTEEISAVRAKRLEMIKTRKTVLSGINDYPDVKEVLNLELKAPPFFRIARVFEELRAQMESHPAKPRVYVALFGDYGALNGRLNFVKNYFELIGLTVVESGKTETDVENFRKNLLAREEEIIVVCAMDDQYPAISEVASEVKQELKFIAGKVEMTSYKNLFAGQNVYEVLENLVARLKGRKS